MHYIFEDQWGVTHEVTLQEQIYAVNHRLRLNMLEDGEPFMTITVNVPDAELEPNEIIIKNYSENKGVLQFLIEESIIENSFKSLSLNGNLCVVAKYRGFIAVDPEDLDTGTKIRLKGDGITELVFWNSETKTGVIERPEGTPVSIDIRDIVQIIR